MRLFGWFRKSDIGNPEPLKPGICECEHSRSCHVGGKGRCTIEFPPDSEWPEGAACACVIFILDKDSGDDGDTEPEPTDPAVKELEKIYKSRCS